jgi:NAD(P)-dependent dehydrogenase (short-subunit alcohol dehydrogenase family)
VVLIPPATGISLQSKVALVTGAAGGIGRAVASMLASHGAHVVLTDIAGSIMGLRDVAGLIEQNGGTALAVPADLRRKAEVNSLVAAALDRFARLDILVNVAGVHLYPSPLLTLSESDWDRVMDINVKGPLHTCQAVVPHMIARGTGSVVNISSDSAFDVIAEEGAYGISKMAVVRLSSYLAKELSATGVRVNSLAPGWVKTRMTETFWSDQAVLANTIKGIPARRIAEPADIAGVVLFLASDLASYVNGHCILVDGGRIAGNPA